MVAEQRETVQRIDADTMDIASNVSGAQRELLKYYASISSNRWLMLKVFGVLIVFVSVLFDIRCMCSKPNLLVPYLHSCFMIWTLGTVLSHIYWMVFITYFHIQNIIWTIECFTG